MKIQFLAFAVIAGLILAAMPVFAQAESCSLGTVTVSNDVTSDLTHSKTTFALNCYSEKINEGQLTKLIYKIPLTDISNFEASDDFGSLKVLEGPDYATAKTSGKESTIGVIFRKGLLITDGKTSYKINVDFDTASLVKIDPNRGYSIKPADLVGDAKATIVSTGVTEAPYAIASINYELALPNGASVQTMPQGCSLADGKVTCTGLDKQAFNSLEIKWTQSSGFGGGILSRITGIFSKITGGSGTAQKSPGLLERIGNKIKSII